MAQNDKSVFGSIIGILVFFLAFVGLLLTSWYTGSSGGSLDSSFGNHCAVNNGDMGSSAQGNVSGASFNSSFDSSNFIGDENACDDVRVPIRENYGCGGKCGRSVRPGSAGWTNDDGIMNYGSAAAAYNATTAARATAENRILQNGESLEALCANMTNADDDYLSPNQQKLVKNFSAGPTQIQTNLTKMGNKIKKRFQANNWLMNDPDSRPKLTKGAKAEKYVGPAGGCLADKFRCDDEFTGAFPAVFMGQQGASDVRGNVYTLAQNDGSVCTSAAALTASANDFYKSKKGSENFSRRSANGQRCNTATAGSNLQGGFMAVNGMLTSGACGTDSKINGRVITALAKNRTGVLDESVGGARYTNGIGASAGAAALDQWTTGTDFNRRCNESKPDLFKKKVSKMN